MFAYNSTKKSRGSTKTDWKVVRTTGDIAHQVQGQRSNVKVTRPLDAVTDNETGRPGSHRLQDILWRPHYKPHRNTLLSVSYYSANEVMLSSSSSPACTTTSA